MSKGLNMSLIKSLDPTINLHEIRANKYDGLHYDYIISKILTVRNTTGQKAWVNQQINCKKKNKTEGNPIILRDLKDINFF